jgi:L-lactate dehydrogenase
MDNKKVTIIGDGAVGSTIAYTLLMKSYINEIDIIDVNKDKVEGDVLDMNQGMSFVANKIIKVGDYSDIKNTDLLIITAGAAQKPGETRIDLLNRNINIFKSILDNVKANLGENTIVLVVSNPVDILSYFTYKYLGIKANRVIGSGTVLDSSRLKVLLSEDTKIDAKNIHAYVIGEHGDSEVMAFSASSIAGIPVKDYCKTCGKCNMKRLENLEEIAKNVKEAAYEIIAKKGATFYAIGLSVERITDAILNNQHSVLTVSSYIESEFNGQIKDVYISLPCVVGRSGIEKRLQVSYSLDEGVHLIESAKKLSDSYNELKLN